MARDVTVLRLSCVSESTQREQQSHPILQWDANGIAPVCNYQPIRYHRDIYSDQQTPKHLVPTPKSLLENYHVATNNFRLFCDSAVEQCRSLQCIYAIISESSQR